jgi:hypothetical protein
VLSQRRLWLSFLMLSPDFAFALVCVTHIR